MNHLEESVARVGFITEVVYSDVDDKDLFLTELATIMDVWCEKHNIDPVAMTKRLYRSCRMVNRMLKD